MKTNKKAKKVKSLQNVNEKDELMIDGQKLTDVFCDNENLKEYVQIEKDVDSSAKEMDIKFDPNADVKLKKKKSLTLKIISCAIICCLIVGGGYAGSILGKIAIGRWFTKAYDPDAVVEADYRESDETIAQWSSSPISSLTAAQVFVVAEKRLNDCTYYSVRTQGVDGSENGRVTADAPFVGKVNQTLHGYRFRNGDVGYFDYYSSGFTDVIKKTNFTFGGNEFYTYNFKSGEWTLEKQRTAEEYIADIGCSAERPIDYIVSTKTVLEQSDCEMNGGFYTYTITLDPNVAVANYAKKMNYIAGLGYPTFESVELKFVVDAEMNFRQIYVKEKYDVPGLAETDAEFMYQFSYENVEIVS